MKRILLFLSLVLLGIPGYAQQVSYTLDHTANNVDCYYSITQCKGRAAVLIRFENRNNNPVTITWNEKFTTSQVPQMSPGFKTKQLTLPPGPSELSGCEDMSQPALLVTGGQVHEAYMADITGFQFSDVAVTQ